MFKPNINSSTMAKHKLPATIINPSIPATTLVKSNTIANTMIDSSLPATKRFKPTFPNNTMVTPNTTVKAMPLISADTMVKNIKLNNSYYQSLPISLARNVAVNNNAEDAEDINETEPNISTNNRFKTFGAVGESSSRVQD